MDCLSLGDNRQFCRPPISPSPHKRAQESFEAREHICPHTSSLFRATGTQEKSEPSAPFQGREPRFPPDTSSNIVSLSWIRGG